MYGKVHSVTYYIDKAHKEKSDENKSKMVYVETGDTRETAIVSQGSVWTPLPNLAFINLKQNYSVRFSISTAVI